MTIGVKCQWELPVGWTGKPQVTQRFACTCVPSAKIKGPIDTNYIALAFLPIFFSGFFGLSNPTRTSSFLPGKRSKKQFQSFQQLKWARGKNDFTSMTRTVRLGTPGESQRRVLAPGEWGSRRPHRCSPHQRLLTANADATRTVLTAQFL